MCVTPGFGGQKFVPSTPGKLRAVRQRIDAHRAQGGRPLRLEVGGGYIGVMAELRRQAVAR